MLYTGNEALLGVIFFSSIAKTGFHSRFLLKRTSCTLFEEKKITPNNASLPVYKQKMHGLTLIEVLIALAIVAIAMTAVIKATSQTIRANDYLQNKTMALWVGEQVLNEARLGLLLLPEAPDTLKQSTNYLGRVWYWQAAQENTPNRRIKKVEVSVFAKENNSDDEVPLISLESYVYHEN